MPLLTAHNPVLEPHILGVLAFAVPLLILPALILPALIIVALIIETPVLRREPATPCRRTASAVLAVISLIAAAPVLVMV
jgi:hypothetical protein